MLDRELSSWKEIAEFLRVSVRTAQLWERERGLPVRRIGGGARARVIVTTSELSLWKEQAALPSNGTAEVSGGDVRVLENGGAVLVRSWRPYIVGAGLVLVLVLCLSFVVSLPGAPVSFRFEPQSLVAVDARGSQVWRQSYSVPFEMDHPQYRVWMGDLMGTGKTWTVFVHDQVGLKGNSIVLCYDDRGVERWRFLPGRTVRTRSEVFAPPYGVARFAVGRVGANPENRVVVSSAGIWWPTQVTLLSREGKPLGEYWHSGGLSRITIDDGDGDGKNEVYLGGVSHSRHAATLVVLDDTSFHGASVEDDPAFALVGFAPARERARIIFPRTCINQRWAPHNYVHQVRFDAGILRVDLHERLTDEPPSVWYTLTKDLRVADVALSDVFTSEHRQYADHTFTNEEIAKLHELQRLR